MPEFTLYADAAKFLTIAESLLGHQEALHNLMLGLARRLAEHPRPPEKRAWMGCFFEAETPQLLLLQTDPDRPLQLGGTLTPAILDALLALLKAEHRQFENVTAPADMAWTFARRWAAVQGLQIETQLELGCFELKQVVWCPEVSGQFRSAQPDELEQICRWSHAFVQEALPREAASGWEAYRDKTAKGIAAGDFFVWEQDGQVVTMCAVNRRMRHGASISLVYTPPNQRGQGLASACVATLSQRLLDQGHRYCALFTDLANPTSNHIYQRIGYRKVGEFANLRFENP